MPTGAHQSACRVALRHLGGGGTLDSMVYYSIA